MNKSKRSPIVKNKNTQPLTKDAEACKAFEDKGKDNAKILRLAMYLVILSIIMTTGTVIIAMLNIKKEYEPAVAATQAQSHPIVCLECIKLTRDVSSDTGSDPLLRQLPRKIEEGIEMCCAHDSVQMSALVQAVMRGGDARPLHVAKYNVSSFHATSSVSAHKQFLYKNHLNMTFNPNIMNQEIDFASPDLCYFSEKDEPGLEHHRGVDILPEGIRIRTGGLYYVYSSINFRPQSRHPCNTFKYQTFFHSVVQYTASAPSDSQYLLKTTHTCCDSCINSEESKFTAGMFLLDPGDVIQARVTGYRLVHLEPTTSFIGLAMLATS